MHQLKIKTVETKQEYKQILDIRKKVFIEEQKVPVEIEIDEYESEATHFIAYLNKEPIGCARVRINDKTAKLERIAIIKKQRGSGFGKQLTNFLINYCKRKNITEIYMHSQLHTADFYKKLGFKTRGKIFYEAGIKHVEMYL